MKELGIFTLFYFLLLQWMDSKLPPEAFKILMTILKISIFYFILIGTVALLGFVYLQISDKMSDDENFIFTPGYTRLQWSDEDIASIFTSGITPVE